MEEHTSRRRSVVAKKRRASPRRTPARATTRTRVLRTPTRTTAISRFVRFATIASEMLLVGALGYMVVTIGSVCAYLGFLVGAQEAIAQQAVIALQRPSVAVVATQHPIVPTP